MTDYTVSQLKSLRGEWIKKGEQDGTITGAMLIARYLGTPFTVENWTSDNWQWKTAQIKLTLYQYVANHFFQFEDGRPVDAWNVRKTIVITVGDRIVCRYRTCSDLADITNGAGWDDAVFIPGDWQRIIQPLIEKAQEEKDKQEQNTDERDLQRLKALLLID